MTIEKIREDVVKVFQSTFKNDGLQVTDEMTANDVDGWDSITHLDLIVAVEKQFEIEINGFDIMVLKNVGDLISLVERKLEA